MGVRPYKAESKELKEASAQYKKHFGFDPPCIYQFHDDEQEMMDAIRKSIASNEPLEYDGIKY